MTNFSRKNPNYIFPLLSLLLPAFLMTAVFLLLEIYPLGETSILSKDMFTQYVSYFSYYQSLFSGEGHNIFYSFSKLLGGDMFGFFSYYLISPFNLISLFFSREQLPAALLVITIVKFSFAGLTSYLFLDRKGTGNPFVTLSLSVSYALMAYNIAFHINLMWLDGMILAPLVILGIEKLVLKRKCGFYIGFLALSLMCNYYIGFMLCLFCILYFIYFMVLSGSLKKSALKKPLIRFTVSSLFAGGISSVIWLPTLLSLQGGIKSGFQLSSLRLGSDCSFLDLFSRIYMGSYTAGPYANRLPYIFCGAGVLFLVLHFFMNPSVSRRRKNCAFTMLAIFLLSFYIEALDLIWHGLSEPIGFPFRYSFLFCLFLIDTAHTSYQKLPRRSIYFKNTRWILGIFIGLTILLEKFQYEWLYTKIFLLELSFLVLAAILLHYSQKLILRWTFTGVVCMELILNAVLIMRQLPYEPYEKYASYVSSLGETIDSIKELDSSFYRMEKEVQMAANDPLLLDYNGISHFSSTVVEQDMNLAEALGFERNITYAFYNTGSTMAVDCLLGLKYIASYEPLYPEYDELYTINGLYVNQNPYALPLGFLVDANAADELDFQADYFAIQNQIFQSISSHSKEKHLLSKASILRTDMENLKLTNSEKGIYEPLDTEADAALSYTLKTSGEGPLYARFASSDMHRAEVFVNGKSVSYYFADSDNGIIRLGDFEAGETAEITIQLWEDRLCLSAPYFYTLDVPLLEEYYQELCSAPYTMTRLSDSHLRGRINADGEKVHLMLTIPYSKGWTAKVDGQKIKPEKALSSFLLVPLEQGEHTVELYYRPRGFYTALGISFFSLLLTVCCLLPGRPAKQHGPQAKR